MGALAEHWTLDPAFDFLNHGSFGACPIPVLAAQQALRAEMEAQPLRFLAREIEARLDAAREALAAFLGTDPAGLAFVPNATTAVATVLASLDLAPGDEVLTTSQVYPAVRLALRRLAERTGAQIVEAAVPFPIGAPEELTEAVLAAVTPRTRFAVLDHVTSPTALVFPVETLVPALRERGIETLVDGAHAPGQIDLAVDTLGAAYYVGNCHKWLCAPKGAGFMAVRADRRAGLRPLVTSHGAAGWRTDRSAFHLEFDWLGTDDPTPYLSVPAAIAFLGGLMPGGWPALRARNHALALEAQALLAAAAGVPVPAPASMIGAMASIPLAPDPGPRLSTFPFLSALQERLYAAGIEVPIFLHPGWPGRVLRVSAYLYNERAQYERLAGLVAADAQLVKTGLANG